MCGRFWKLIEGNLRDHRERQWADARPTCHTVVGHDDPHDQRATKAVTTVCLRHLLLLPFIIIDSHILQITIKFISQHGHPFFSGLKLVLENLLTMLTRYFLLAGTSYIDEVFYYL